MQSPYSKIIVYDLETGGLNYRINPITEIAMVCIDLETLSIIDQMSVMFRPQLDLSFLDESPSKEAKDIFKCLKTKDLDSGLNIINYKGEKLTLKTLQILIDDLEKLNTFLLKRSKIISWEDFLEIKKDEQLCDVISIVFDKCYNPQALDVTHIAIKDLLEGEDPSICFEKINDFIKKHTDRNNKPIFSGHNIGSLPRRIIKEKKKVQMVLIIHLW